MASRLHRKPPAPSTDTWSNQAASRKPDSVQTNGKKELDDYITDFISNGLELQNELMVNHEAIDAARREYIAEFQRKKRSSS